MPSRGFPDTQSTTALQGTLSCACFTGKEAGTQGEKGACPGPLRKLGVETPQSGPPDFSTQYLEWGEGHTGGGPRGAVSDGGLPAVYHTLLLQGPLC